MPLPLSDALVEKYLSLPEAIKDSTTYQRIIREGRVLEARQLLLRLGVKRFGSPGAGARAALEAIRDVDRLEELDERILDAEVHDWNGLLGPA